MATYDISKVDFDPRKHYAGVRMQHGSVLSDDDGKKNERIEREETSRSTVDIVGPYGSPDNGFRIDGVGFPDGKIDFNILAGTLYLGGLRLVMDESETYRLQKDWLQGPEMVDMPSAAELEAVKGNRFDLVYIEAWQQPVNAVEDSALFEVALGGPDTSTRVRNMRRVRIWPDVGIGDCAKAWEHLKNTWAENDLGSVNQQHERIPDVRLSVSFTGENSGDDLCSPFAAGGYLGAENQAIRVQITSDDTLTWGFDNASSLYRAVLREDGRVDLLTAPKDQHQWPLSGQVVELLPWLAVLANDEKVAEQRGYFSKVLQSYDPDEEYFTLVLPPHPDPEFFKLGEAWEKELTESNRYVFVRIWNRGDDLSSEPKLEFTSGEALPLGNTGLAVTITGSDIVPGDFWVIAVRPETPNRVIPEDLLEASGMPPIGVRRFFAPLAIIRWTTETREVVGKVIHDCRKKFRPLTEQDCCCTYTVGDGVHSHGDFNSIQEAVDSLPEGGGKICVLPGQHLASVKIFNRRNIRIAGCGEHTIIRPHPTRLPEPIFRIEHSQGIRLCELSLITFRGTAIVLEDHDKQFPFSREIIISDNRILACIHAIFIRMGNLAGSNQIEILRNRIGMLDMEIGDVAIFSLADDVRIERNHIVVVPAPPPDKPDAPQDEEVPPGKPQDPCLDPIELYKSDFDLSAYAFSFFSYVAGIRKMSRPIVYKTKGGIQIVGTSERVQIIENLIIGGRGNGITFGNLPIDMVEQIPFSSGNIIALLPPPANRAAIATNVHNTLYDIRIEGNYIHRMGLSGIGTVAFFHTRIGLIVRVEDLTIYRNNITHCAQQTPEKVPDEMLPHVGFGGIGLAACENCIIQENKIEDNGVSHLNPVCGIFFQHAEKIDISNNSILNNGLRTTDSNLQVLPGNRGGIVIKMAIKPDFFPLTGNADILKPDGIPAVRIHQNIVVQPIGHALFVMAYGPVSVVGNQMTSQGRDIRNIFSALAGAVFIFNLGVSKDYLRLNLFKLQNLANANISSFNQNHTSLPQIMRLFLLPGGSTLIGNNQFTLDIQSRERDLVFSAQMVFSLDDVAFNSNQAECASYSARFPYITNQVIYNTYLFGISVRANDNRFQEGATSTIYSLFSYGYMSMALGNQATHCLLVLGTRRPPNSVLNSNNIVLFSARCNADLTQLSTHLNLPPGSEVATSD